MSRSPYIDEVILTPKHSGKRTHKVQAFVLHHMAAVWTGKRCAEYLRDTPSRQASANYYIGHEGDVVLGVEEENRAWTSSSNWADQRALTYELANSKYGHPWEVSDATIQKAIVMLAEQHKRYGLKEASYTGDTKGTLWRHDFFANTNCPGPYLGGKLQYIADEINKILNGEAETHVVEKGDTLWGISRQHDVSVSELKEWNGLDGDLIKPGQELVLKQQQVVKPSSKPEPKPERKPSTDIAGAKLVKNEDAYFLATSNIKVRNQPSTRATHTGTLPEGASINYKRVFEGNGYRWLEYTGNSGNTLYLPYRRLTGDTKSWGTFHSSRPEPKPVVINAGDKVVLNASASKYATGETIPSNRKNKTYTAQQVSADLILLKEIRSWVHRKDLTKK